MGYRHPERKLSARDIPDPELFRQQIGAVAQEVAGNANEHNVVQATFPSSRVSNGLYTDFHYTSTSADAHIDTNGTTLPDALDASAWQVPDGGDWQAVGNGTLVYTTAEHTVWAIGWLYYGVVGTLDQWRANRAVYTLARVQFAIRVNGAILEESITGTERPDDGAPRTLRPIDAVTATPAFRSLDFEAVRGTGALSWQCRAVRVQAQFAAPQGTTTVELVARRVIADMPNVNGSAPPVCVYNRRLCAVEMKLGEQGPVTGQTVTVDFPDDGDPLTAATTYTAQLSPVVTAMNSLSMDAVRRFGLRKEHFPAAALPTRTLAGVGRVSGSFTNKVYPGFANTGAVGVSPNWTIVQDGGGLQTIATLNDGSGSWNFTNNPGFMLVFGNVAFAKADGSGNRPDRYGTFGIGFLYASAATTLGDGASYVDQAFVNNPNIDLFAGSPISRECLTDVPLFGFYDFRSAPPANGPVSAVRLLVSSFNAGTPRVDWENSSIYVVIFRK